MALEHVAPVPMLKIELAVSLRRNVLGGDRDGDEAMEMVIDMP